MPEILPQVYTGMTSLYIPHAAQVAHHLAPPCAVRSRAAWPSYGVGRTGAWMAALVLGAASCRAPLPRAHVITIRGFQYVPASLTVALGDTVLWKNADLVPHTATAMQKEFDTGGIESKALGQFVATDAGTHQYVCAFHPTMRGTLIVR
ncbi:MAG: cupredoxin family copper-binding protein [Gemmatimonadaceae bacterium]